MVWNLVFISSGGLFGCTYVVSMATRYIVQSSPRMQEGVSFSRWSQCSLFFPLSPLAMFLLKEQPPKEETPLFTKFLRTTWKTLGPPWAFFSPAKYRGRGHAPEGGWHFCSNSAIEEERLKFYITSYSCLCNSACSLQSLDHVGLRKWGLTVLGTEAYLTHPCPAVCNRPAPANPQTHLIMPVRCIKTL